MRVTRFVLLIFCLSAYCVAIGQRSDGNLKTAQLYELFKNPESQYYPFVRWWWNGDKVEAGELKRELRLLKGAEIGGVEINPVSFPSYCDSIGKPSLLWLSPEWTDMLRVTFDEAKRLDMTCDLIVGSGWPFGAEYLADKQRAQIVVNYADSVSGPASIEVITDSLIKKAMPGISSPYRGAEAELMALRLYPNPASDISEAIDIPYDADAKIISVNVPEGNYTLSAIVKVTGFMEVILGAPGAAGPVVNHYDTEAVNRYLNTMSDTIQKRIGPLKNDIRALFTDSMELEGANWCDDMADEFERHYGYDIREYLPFILFKIGSMGSALNYNPVVPVTKAFNEKVQRARYDFESFKATLMTERFTNTYLAWCHGLGVKARAQAYGRGFFPLENAMGYDIPEGEAWTTNWLHHKPGEEMSESDYRRGRAYTMVNKFVSSAAHLAGNRTMSCEEMTNVYTVFNMTLEQLKLGGDQAAISGISHSIFHGFNYSPNKEVPFPGWVRYGAYYSENNTWWPYFKYYNEYKARLSAALQHGTMYADMAILNPENDMWSTIGMQNEPFPNVTRAPYKTMIWEAISKCGGGTDYVTENIIGKAEVKKGNLCFNERKYNTLILIDVESLEPETADKLLEFARSGGKILCIDTIPYKSLGLRKDYLQRDSIVNDRFRKISMMRDCFTFAEPPKQNYIAWCDSLMQVGVLPHYLDVEVPDPYVMQNRYTTDDGCEMLFVSNSSRYNAHQTKMTFHKSLTRHKHPWIWDLQTGERYRFTLDRNGSRTFDIGPAESYLIVFDKKKKGQTWQPLIERFRNDRLMADISEDWDVELIDSMKDTTSYAHFDTLIDLKDNEGFKYFAGTIVYRKTINIANSGETILNLGLVEGVSEVIVNGKSAGVQYFGRRLYDISDLMKSGDNDIEVRVTTTLGNYMKSLPDSNRVAYVYVNCKKRFQDFQPQGMMGPVTLFGK